MLTKKCMTCQKEMPWLDNCPCLLRISREIEDQADRRFRGEVKPTKKKKGKND